MDYYGSHRSVGWLQHICSSKPTGFVSSLCTIIFILIRHMHDTTSNDLLMVTKINKTREMDMRLRKIKATRMYFALGPHTILVSETDVPAPLGSSISSIRHTGTRVASSILLCLCLASTFLCWKKVKLK